MYISPFNPEMKCQPGIAMQDVSRNDPWEVAAHEAALQAGRGATSPSCGVQLLREMELFVEPEDQSNTVGPEEQLCVQQ